MFFSTVLPIVWHRSRWKYYRQPVLGQMTNLHLHVQPFWRRLHMRRKTKSEGSESRRQDWVFQISISRRPLSLAAFDHQNRNAVIGMQLMNSLLGIARNAALVKSDRRSAVPNSP
jgi:hypothetical protein